MSDSIMADFACLDPVYVDGIVYEGLANLGANFATPFFRWTPTVSNSGVVVFERTPALFLVRPRSSLLPRSPLAALLDRQSPPDQHALEFKQLAH
jgi:hypothetical protein